MEQVSYTNCRMKHHEEASACRLSRAEAVSKPKARSMQKRLVSMRCSQLLNRRLISRSRHLNGNWY
jgi:hypothetical protein